MREIFISYRRDDAEGQAGRLFSDLTQHFGDDAVFMDVAAIEPGRDFRQAIEEQVASCGVLLAIIGKSWLTAKAESGARRLDDPMDFVRLETASALKRDIPVVPVLVQAARMPRVEDLPEDLKELAFRNGVELTHSRWDSDVQVLVKALRPYVQTKQEPTRARLHSASSEQSPTRTGSSRMILVVLFSVLVLAFGGYGGYVWYQESSEGAARASQEPSASSKNEQFQVKIAWQKALALINTPLPHLGSSDGVSATNREKFLLILEPLQQMRLGTDIDTEVSRLHELVIKAPANPGDNFYNMRLTSEISQLFDSMRQKIRLKAIEQGVN